MSHDSAGAPKRAKEILAYFLRCPTAVDSIEGVARWRLRQESIHQTVQEVGEAMEWLAAHHFLLAQRPFGSAQIYWLNQSAAPSAEQFVSAAGEPPARRARGRRRRARAPRAR